MAVKAKTIPITPVAMAGQMMQQQRQQAPADRT